MIFTIFGINLAINVILQVGLLRHAYKEINRDYKYVRVGWRGIEAGDCSVPGISINPKTFKRSWVQIIKRKNSGLLLFFVRLLFAALILSGTFLLPQGVAFLLNKLGIDLRIW